MPRKTAEHEQGDASSLLTPLHIAVKEIEKRRTDKALVQNIEAYLGKDIPEYFKRSRPTLYLARHVASPNFETLRFIELAKPLALPMVIGQDFSDKFVGNNSLKRALGKMPVVKCISSDHREQIENFTIIDFSKAQGLALRDVHTIFNIPLTKFHNDLLLEIYPHAVELVDESVWIDRNHRGNLLEHYKKFLALFLVHGVMFEYYPEEEDAFFVENILRPAYTFVTEMFGVSPLITPLVDNDIAYIRNWNAYPSILYPHVKGACKGMCFDPLIVPPAKIDHLSEPDTAPSCNALA